MFAVTGWSLVGAGVLILILLGILIWVLANPFRVVRDREEKRE